MATTAKKGARTAAKSSSVSLEKNSKSDRLENSEFHELFVEELKDIYWAEKHLVKALPKLKKAATSPELAAAFEKHAEETETHVATLDQVFMLLDEKARAKKCDAMEGLLKEAENVILNTDAGSLVRDAGLILAAQKVEHYEIATYGTLVVFARTMGQSEVADLLEYTLSNEKETDAALTEVAESFVNEQAASE